MLSRFLEPKSSDDDSKYRGEAIAVAERFAVALGAKRYSELWHELAARETWAIVPALAYLNRREDIAAAFGLAPEEATREFLTYAVDNDLEKTRTGFWAGVRKVSRKHGWLRGDSDAAQVVFMGSGAIVYVANGGVPFVLPLLYVPGDGYRVDIETLTVAARVTGVGKFVEASRVATDSGDFARAIRLLSYASRLGRSHDLLRQYAWESILTDERRGELASDAALLSQVDVLLAENREYASLDVGEAIRRDEQETTDFKEQAPSAKEDDSRRRLARVFAAFASTAGGRIYFGVTDAREVLGVPEASTEAGRDDIRKRIDRICGGRVRPTITAKTLFLPAEGSAGPVVVPLAVVPRGPEPVYYVDEKPYIRRGQEAVPAQPHEVAELHRRHLKGQGWRAPSAVVGEGEDGP